MSRAEGLECVLKKGWTATGDSFAALPFVDVDVDEASPEAITASVLRRSGVLVRFLLVPIKKEML